MAKDLHYLGTLMDKVALAVVQDANTFESEVISNTVAELAKNTPIDTAKARSNWAVSINNPFSGIRAAFSPFLSRYKHGDGGTMGETRNQAGVVWAAASVLKTNKDGAPVYISNNLPYIQRLNEGWSDQAPAGFIQAAVIAGRARAVTLFRFTNIEKLF